MLLQFTPISVSTMSICIESQQLSCGTSSVCGYLVFVNRSMNDDEKWSLHPSYKGEIRRNNIYIPTKSLRKSIFLSRYQFSSMKLATYYGIPEKGK